MPSIAIGALIGIGTLIIIMEAFDRGDAYCNEGMKSNHYSV